jgi:NADH-quinone oxidoreductase subunit E
MLETLEKTEKMIKHLEAVNRILDSYEYNKTKLIPILQAVQAEYKYLSKDIISYVATSLGLPPARVFGVATFYAHFSMEPKGKHVFKLCDGTACHVKGSTKILDALYEKLGLSKENPTTPDMLFTVETVSCLGACGLAPVMLVDEEVHGQITPEAAVKIVDELLEQEKREKEMA